MPYKIEPVSGGVRDLLAKQKARAAWLRPAAAKAGEYIAREARRRAPRGQSRRMQSLSASLNHREPEHNVTVLVSDKQYAMIQNFGGTITAGTGKLAARALTIPMNDAARKAVEQLGAGVSLRALKLTFVLTPKGAFLIGDVAGVGKKAKRKKGEPATREPGFAVFKLQTSVKLRANPQPDGYAPRANDSAVRDFIRRTLIRYLKTGTP